MSVVPQMRADATATAVATQTDLLVCDSGLSRRCQCERGVMRYSIDSKCKTRDE